MSAEERRDETWNQMYEELAAFQRENGHCRVPRADNRPLCFWVKNQRDLYKNRQQEVSPSISDGRIQMLETLGFEWSIRKAPLGEQVVLREEGWDDMYETLLDYLNSFNTTDVPMGYVHNEKQLGYWVQVQRNNFHNSSEGNEPSLPDNRRTKLELINFDFRPLEARKLLTKDQLWDDMYYAAVFFHEDHGHFRVSNNFFHRGKLLHKWLHNNRHYYKNRSNGSGQFAISDSRAEKMLAAGMLEDGLEDVASCLAQIPLKPKSRSRCFSLSVDDKWEELFEVLVSFKKEFKHTVVPFGTTRDGQPLGFWVRVQQNAYHNASKHLKPVLVTNRIERLASIDFDYLSEQAFEAQTAKLSAEQKWQDMCYALYFFRQDYGDMPVSREFMHVGRSLGTWWYKNQSLYRNRARGAASNAMTDQRAQTMESLGLVEPRSIDESSPLSTTPSRPSMTSRTLVLPEPGDDNWDRLFQGLLSFKKEFKHTVVSFGTIRDGQPLGFWVRVQRNAYHNVSRNFSPVLTKDRLNRLNSIDFDFLPEKMFESQTAMLSAEQRWQDMCYALYFFRQDYGDKPVSKEFMHAGKSLGSWLHKNRQLYRNRERGNVSSTMKDERVQTMESLGLIACLRGTDVPKDNAGELVELPLRNAVDQILLAVFSDAGAEPGDEGNIKCQAQGTEHAEVDATSTGGDSEPVLINEEYDDVAYRRMENELIDLLDRSIYIAEEKELLDTLDREIDLAEIEAVQRPGVLVNENRGAPESNRHGRGVHEEAVMASPDNELVLESVRVTKLLPRYVGSSNARFATFEEIEENLVRNFKDDLTQRELSGFCVQVDVVPGDEMSVCLRVEGQRRVVEAFRSRLHTWCDAMVRRLTFLKLSDDGIRLTVDLDPSVQLGAQIRSFSAYKNTAAGMLIGVHNVDGQLARVVGVHTLRHGAALIAINGRPCTSLNDFKNDLRQAGKNKVRLELAVWHGTDLNNHAPNSSASLGNDNSGAAYPSGRTTTDRAETDSRITDGADGSFGGPRKRPRPEEPNPDATPSAHLPGGRSVHRWLNNTGDATEIPLESASSSLKTAPSTPRPVAAKASVVLPGCEPDETPELWNSIKHGTFADTLQLLDSGILSRIESAPLLEQLRALLKAKLQTEDSGDPSLAGSVRQDLEMKDTLLKIYLAAECAIRSTRSLSLWSSFEIIVLEVDGIRVPLRERSSGYIQVLPFRVRDDQEESLKPIPLAKLLSSKLVYDDQSKYHLHFNPALSSVQALGFRVNLVHKTGTLIRDFGCCRIHLSKLESRCSRDGTWQEAVAVSGGPTIWIRARLFEDPSLIERKKCQEVNRITKLQEWIDRFNSDPRRIEPVRNLSANIRLDGFSLLHATILLEDPTLVTRLVRQGADPLVPCGDNGSAFSFAAGLAQMKSSSDGLLPTINSSRLQQIVASLQDCANARNFSSLSLSEQTGASEPVGVMENSGGGEIRENMETIEAIGTINCEAVEESVHDASMRDVEPVETIVLERIEVPNSDEVWNFNDGQALNSGDAPTSDPSCSRFAQQNDPSTAGLAQSELSFTGDEVTWERASLPVLFNPLWVLDKEEMNRCCPRLSAQGYCHTTCNGCEFVHVLPLWKRSDFEALCDSTDKMLPHVIPQASYERLCQTLITVHGSNLFFTAAFRSVVNRRGDRKVVVFAQGGSSSRVSAQGLYWYPSGSDARHALRRSVIVSYSNQGSSYTQFYDCEALTSLKLGDSIDPSVSTDTNMTTNGCAVSVEDNEVAHVAREETSGLAIPIAALNERANTEARGGDPAQSGEEGEIEEGPGSTLTIGVEGATDNFLGSMLRPALCELDSGRVGDVNSACKSSKRSDEMKMIAGTDIEHAFDASSPTPEALTNPPTSNSSSGMTSVASVLTRTIERSIEDTVDSNVVDTHDGSEQPDRVDSPWNNASLPRLSNPLWALDEQARKLRCRSLSEHGACRQGRDRCPYVHVQLLWERSFFERIIVFSLKNHDLPETIRHNEFLKNSKTLAVSCASNLFFTAAFSTAVNRPHNHQEVIFAQGGTDCRVCEHGLYWYSSGAAAREALKRSLIVADFATTQIIGYQRFYDRNAFTYAIQARRQPASRKGARERSGDDTDSQGSPKHRRAL